LRQVRQPSRVLTEGSSELVAGNDSEFSRSEE
jgi:hypothetical protein